MQLHPFRVRRLAYQAATGGSSVEHTRLLWRLRARSARTGRVLAIRESLAPSCNLKSARWRCVASLRVTLCIDMRRFRLRVLATLLYCDGLTVPSPAHPPLSRHASGRLPLSVSLPVPTTAGRWLVGRCALTLSARKLFPADACRVACWVAARRSQWCRQCRNRRGCFALPCQGVSQKGFSAGEGYRPEQVVFVAAPNAFQ